MGRAAAVVVILAGASAAADLQSLVWLVVLHCILHRTAFCLEGRTAGIAAVAGMVAADLDAGQAAAALGIVGAAHNAALQIGHRNSLHCWRKAPGLSHWLRF